MLYTFRYLSIASLEFNSITDNPQNLRFDFTPRETTKKKKDVTVYKEQVSALDTIVIFMYVTQDRFLPIANVGRVMKNALPSSGRVSLLIRES